MPFVKNPKIKIWLVRLVVLLLGALSAFWIATQALVPGLIKKAAAQYGAQLGYEISYQYLSLSPLRLRVELDGFELSKAGNKQLLGFKKLTIALKWTKLIVGELGFDEIILDEPKLLIERVTQKSHGAQHASLWNWQELIQAIEKNMPPKESGQEGGPIKISVGQLQVNAGSLSLLDESINLKEELKPFSVKLLEVANYDKNGVVSGLRGQYDFNLGSLQALVPGINKTIAFKQVGIGGGLDNPSPDRLGLQVDLRLDGGNIRSHWDLNKTSNNLEGKVTVDSVATAPLVALLPANKELLGVSGILNADLAVKVGGDAEVVSGDLHFLNFSVIEKGEKTPLVNWDSADIRHFEYKSSNKAGVKTAALLIDEVAIDRPSLRFDINEQGLSNFRRLFATQQPQASSTQTTAGQEAVQLEPADRNTSKAAESAKSGFELDIRTVNLKQGEVFFKDMAMRPHFKVDIKKFNATLLGVSNVPGRFASVAMDGVVAGSGSMRTKGQVSFDDPRRNHDVLMSFRNLPLTTFNPAVMTYAGYQITGGNLNLNLNYRSKDGQLNGSNQIIIKKVQLGEEVPDYQGKKLPLGLAIALLEDSDDTIDITIRIAGNVDSPEFSASGLVWQAISNVLTNVATAPFRALGALLGMSGDEGINAVPGEVVFLPPDQERLEKFSEYLMKRPNSELVIVGTYDPVQDKQELARVRADTAILSEAGFKLTANEPVPIPSLSDPRIQTGLKAAYVQYIGRIKLTQRLLMLPEGDARNEQLRNELIAAMEITETELRELASNRANLAIQIMIKDNPPLSERIKAGEVKAVAAGKEGIPLEVEVRIK
jgi:hypothetical protein